VILTILPVGWDKMPPIGISILKNYRDDIKCMDLRADSKDFSNLFNNLKISKMEVKKFLKNYSDSISYFHNSKKSYGITRWVVNEYMIKLLNEPNEDFNNLFHKIADRLNDDIVGFSTWKGNLGISLNVAKILHEKGIKTIFGGPGVLFPNISKYDFVDAICIGEGENIFKEMTEHLGEKKIWMSNDFVDMNKIPTPDYSDFNMNNYEYIGIESQRGCVNHCAYCNLREFPNKGEYRQKSIDNIIKEIKKLKKYNKPFFFCDNITNPNKERITKLAQRLREENIKWTAEMFPNIDKDLAILLKKSGCFQIKLGVESLSNHALRKMNKNLKWDESIRSLKNLHDVGIITQPLFFFGFPTESIWDVFITLIRIFKYRKYIDQTGLGFYHLSYNSLVHKYPNNFIINLKNIDDEWCRINDMVPYEDNNKLKHLMTKEVIEFTKDFLYYEGKHPYSDWW